MVVQEEVKTLPFGDVRNYFCEECGIPADWLAEIEKYEKSDAGKPSAFTSESFGGYAYSKATNAKGVPLSWKGVFEDDLRPWRMI